MELKVQASEESGKPLHVGSAEDRGGVAIRCSSARGRSMSPGIQRGHWYWRDVVHGPPPRKRTRGDAIHVTLHGIDADIDVRLAYTTVVHVDPGLDHNDPRDDIIHVEERLSVQKRVLHEIIERERAFSDRLALRWRSRLARSLVAQRRFAAGRRFAWSRSLTMRMVRVQAKVGDAVIRGTRAFLRSLVAGPDWVLTHSETVGIHLVSRTGRSGLRRALRDPASATALEKSVALMIASVGILLAVLILNTVFAAIIVGAAPVYQAELGDFISALLGTLALPIPIEPLLVARVLRVGIFLGVIGLFFGKMVGSWILFLLGDSLNDTLEKQAAKSPRLGRGLKWIQSRANKYGFWLLIPINAVPLVPDVAMYPFAVSGMRFGAFMGGIAVGTVLKFALLIGLVLYFGPDTMNQWLSHPIESIRGA